MPIASSAISITGVTKRFGKTIAVRSLDFELPRGSLCGFLGPNGAGKSTTIRMIMSIILPDEGTIRVLGGSALDSKDRIGYLPEERGVYRKMRVGEFLAYMAKLKGVPSRGMDRRVEDWLDRVELPGVVRKRLSDLSKGMQQKVQFIAAMIHDPELLILDEPFSGLDPVNARVMRDLVHELHRKGRTIILSTHLLPQAEALCERIVLINHGIKLLDDPLDRIREAFDPRTIVVLPASDAPGDGAPALLEELPGVVGARPLADGRIELHLDERTDPQATMRAALESMPLRGVELRRTTLEEIFVRLVRREEGTEAARSAQMALAGAAADAAVAGEVA
ncbi:MAG TPA: ATP-binding cassette domain-containing protein [Phycisphaerales bacterium]|nr:ATP-binding cassette domain-containing protein [Phycisphaerales bacterium]HMP36839.1 ATP-binding cassette domain-containing protein [Phycisphaerales bacterium]